MDYSIPKKPESQYVDPREYQGDQVMNFLKKISALESSSGKNINHKPMTKGMHAGTAAIGEYGLMPLTAKDLDKQNNVNELQDLSNDEVAQKLQSDPDLYNRLAATLASKLLDKNPSEVAAHKWEHGQYSRPSEQELANSERIRRFRVLKNE